MVPPMPTLASCPLQQSPLYATALERIGAGTRWHDLPGGPVLAVTRRHMALGTVALVSRPMSALPRDLRRALGARVLIVNAETPAQGATLAQAGLVRLAPARKVALLPLVGQPDDWLARMDGKWRNRLRHAMRQGLDLRIAPLPPDPNHWLFHREVAQQAARGYRNLPPALVAAMAAGDPGALTLFCARASGRTLAAMLFARHGGTASYLIGWSDAAGRAASAHNLLLWTAMTGLGATGVQAIDLGSCDTRRAPGLARFKLGSGAYFHPMGGTWADVGALAPLHAALRTAHALRGAIPGTIPSRPATAPCTGHAAGR